MLCGVPRAPPRASPTGGRRRRRASLWHRSRTAACTGAAQRVHISRKTRQTGWTIHTRESPSTRLHRRLHRFALPSPVSGCRYLSREPQRGSLPCALSASSVTKRAPSRGSELAGEGLKRAAALLRSRLLSLLAGRALLLVVTGTAAAGATTVGVTRPWVDAPCPMSRP